MADLIIGISQQTCNEVSADVFSRFKSSDIFTGAGSGPPPDFSYTWAVIEAPVFDLSPPAQGNARKFYADRLELPHHRRGAFYHPVSTFLQEAPAFQIGLPTVRLQFTLSGTKGEPFDISVKVDCSLTADEAGITRLTPFNATADLKEIKDQFTRKVINDEVLPVLLERQRQLLSTLSIPAIKDWEGVTFGLPTPAIKNGYLVVSLQMTNLNHAPGGFAPELPTGSNFFLLASVNLLEQAARVGISAIPISGSGRESEGPLFADWHYGLSLHNARIGLPGDYPVVTLSMGGSVGASAGLDMGCTDLSAGLGLAAKAEPDPSVTLEMAVSGNNEISARAKQVSYFIIIVYPDGGVVSWITGGFISLLTMAIANSITGQFMPKLREIYFKVGKVPAFSLKEYGTTFDIEPLPRSFRNYEGMLLTEGEVRITVSGSGKDSGGSV